jgi:hypothetical protein
MARVAWHPDGLYPRVGFSVGDMVGDLARSAAGILAFPDQRGP